MTQDSHDAPANGEARAVEAASDRSLLRRFQEGDADGALASARAVLNAGRSVGDEPGIMSQLVRMGRQYWAVRAVERTLAQGQPSPDALAAWRGQLTGRTAGRLTASFVKHADEQTVAALAGVLQAAEDHGLHLSEMSAWGVLSAPRYFGRVALAQSMLRFAAEGAWGLSPHMIPHRSLHSVSGTISQALNLQGLNLGVQDMILISSMTTTPAALDGYGLKIVGRVPVPTED